MCNFQTLCVSDILNSLCEIALNSSEVITDIKIHFRVPLLTLGQLPQKQPSRMRLNWSQLRPFNITTPIQIANKSNLNPCVLRIPPSLPMVTDTLDSYISSQITLNNYKPMNIRKLGTYVKGYANYYICFQFERYSTHKGPGNVQKV